MPMRRIAAAAVAALVTASGQAMPTGAAGRLADVPMTHIGVVVSDLERAARAYAGVLQTCDTYFNAFNTQWSTDPVTPADTMDLETVALHEAGHCLGLGHFIPYDAVMDQVVSPGESVRVLSPTDVTMLCNRYPLPGANGAACLGDGGCLAGTDKCLLQPTTGGLTLKLCTAGCAVNTNANCDVPFTCQASMAFPNYTGACLLPGSAVTEVGKACVQNADCPRPSSVLVCSEREDQLRDCIACSNNLCVRYRPEACP